MDTHLATKSELLTWLANEFDIHIAKIEQCGNGVVYLKIMDKLFPGKVQLHKAKLEANQEWENLHNLKLLQMLFVECNVQKKLNLQRVAKCLYIDNLEVLQWMKQYYERQHGYTENNFYMYQNRLDKADSLFSGASHHSPRSATSKTSSKANTFITTPFKQLKSTSNQKVSTTIKASTARDNITTPALENRKQTFKKFQDRIAAQAQEISELRQELLQVDEERLFFYKKLRQFEVMAEDPNRKDFSIQEVQEILFTEYAPEQESQDSKPDAEAATKAEKPDAKATNLLEPESNSLENVPPGTQKAAVA